MPRPLTTLGLAACALAGALLAAPAGTARASGPVGLEATLLDLVNAERQGHGLAPLAWDDDLAALARAHAQDIRDAGIASHHSTGDGAVFADRLERAGLPARRWAENVALAGDLLEVHSGFLRSEGHRRNLLDPDLTDVGLGIAESADGLALFVVQDFASLVRQLDDGQAALAVEAALHALERRQRPDTLHAAPALQREADRLARRMALLDGESPPGAPGVAHDLTYAYTSSDPAILPVSLRELAAASGEYGLGVAWRRTPTFPQGTYFVCVLLRDVR